MTHAWRFRGLSKWLYRATALLLSWVLTASTAWASAPPPSAAPAAPGRMVPESPFTDGWQSAAQPAMDTAVPEPQAVRVAATFDPALALPAPEPLPRPEPAPLAATSTPAGGSTVSIFGAQKFVRTTGAKDVYTLTANVPAWVISPYVMHVQNGEADGSNRVSSAWIQVNGSDVAVPNDFNPKIPAIDRAVTLTPQTTLVVTLASKPGTYLYIGFSGTNGDATAPRVAVTAPNPGAVIPTARPRLAVEYQDLVGPGEPAASGVDLATLQVLLDGVDRTSLFTKRSGDASADLPASLALAEGDHTLQATIKDVAGNPASATASFRVDLTPPTLVVTQPAAGAYLADASPTIVIEYADNFGLDLGSLHVDVNGADQSVLFGKGPKEATASLVGRLTLPAGGNQLVARISDLAGNGTTGSTAFNVDLEPPVVTIARPEAGSRNGGSDVEVIIRYRDDQKLDLGSFAASIDGVPLTTLVAADGATGRVTVADGPHTIAASIRDAARNLGPASATFSVDTVAPEVHVREPLAGSYVAQSTTQVRVDYSDAQGLDASTLRVTIDGEDRTSAFAVAPSAATAQVGFADGEHTVAAEIKDFSKNTGLDSSTFVVDTVAPAGALTTPAPGSVVGAAQVSLTISYSDAVSGIDVASVRVSMDGEDVTPSFVAGPTAVVGTPTLADGPHTVGVNVADRARNVGPIGGSFFVDTVPPTASFSEPADGAFLNTPTPAIRLGYGDGAGSGVDPRSVHVYLQARTAAGGPPAPEIEITGWLSVRDAEAVGAVPASAALADGDYQLRATLQDKAGHPIAPSAIFEVDTVPPTGSIPSPAAGAALRTKTPAVLVRYQDDRSGVDTNRLVLRVDGADRTAILAKGASEASGTLPDPLPEGKHQVQLTVVDRAGNETVLPAQEFVVDTIAPSAAVEAPADGAYLGTSTPHVRFTFGDGEGSGIDLASVKIQVDGADRTAEFTIGAGVAETTLATPLADGAHTVRIDVADKAANPGAAQAGFTLDTTAPSVAIASPADGSYVARSPVSVSGTAADADPQLAVSCQPAGVAGAVASGGFTCSVPLVEGANTITATASDRLMHQASDSHAVVLDTIPPQVTVLQPQPHDYVKAETITVRGNVVDASPVAVDVEGVAAVVEGSTFTATGVPVGAGPEVTLHVVATDAAGNTGPAEVPITVDRTPPVVQILTPVADAYLKGPTLVVTGTVADASPVVVDVNGIAGTVTGGEFTASLPVVDGLLPIVATAHDAAGNAGSAERSIHIDLTPPVITVSSPGGGLITNAMVLPVMGTVEDASPVTLEFAGTPVPLTENAFSFEAPIPLDGVLTLTATDAAGNVGTAAVQLVVDRTPPELEVVTPTADAVLGALPVVVQGFVYDATPTGVTVDGAAATRTRDAWQLPVAGLPDGPHTFTVVATDGAGNQTTGTVTVLLDLVPPTIAIAIPATGWLTNQSTTLVSGRVTGRSVSVTVNGVAAQVSGGTFSATVPLVEGDNPLQAVATSIAKHSAEASIVVTMDATPPVVGLTAPETIAKDRPAKAVATASDTVHLEQVLLSADGVAPKTFTEPPFEIDLVVPAGAQNGDTLVVTAVATDAAGNTATTSRGVKVVSQGVVAGRVLLDATSLPLEGATVALGTEGTVSTTTNEEGEYTLPVSDASAVLIVSKPEMTTVERSVSVATGVGTVPVDARLTAIPEPQTIGSGGGSLTAGGWTVEVPAGAVAADTPFVLLPLSSQGLPGLLPVGWTPLSAATLQGSGVSGALAATVKGLPARELTLVSYSLSLHDWVLASSSLSPDTEGQLAFSLPAPGSYALVVPDSVDLAPSVVGEVLPASAMEPIPATATSTGTANPSSLPPSGGTAQASLQVQSEAPLPSGTVVTARVSEVFTLAGGAVASTEERLVDAVLFRRQTTEPPDPSTPQPALAGAIPVTPSRSFAETELSDGNVHLDILSGRESVRGKTGGSSAAQVLDGETLLSVPAQGLGTEIVVDVAASPLSSFLPAPSGLVPLAEAVVDLSNATLTIGAELAFSAAGASAGDTLLVARVERVNGIPKLMVVSFARIRGERIVSIPTPGLPGIKVGGRYVLYRSAQPVGLVTGTVASSAGPVRAVVQGEGLPFVALSEATGAYALVAAVGAVAVTAQVPDTALAGTGTATVAAGETATLDLLLVGTVTTATVVPENDATGLERNVSIQVTSPTALNPATVKTSNVKLLKGAEPVTVRLVLSGSAKTLAVISESLLEYSMTYTLSASGLADVVGGLVQVPAVSFRIKDYVAPVYNTSALSFSVPKDGVTTVSAPEGTFPPGTTILIIDSGNGAVLSLTAGNAGEVAPMEMPASIDDEMVITITDPLGNVTTFRRSQFLELDAGGNWTGNVAVGPGGGTVTAADGSGMELRIPEGALLDGVKLKVSSFTLESLPEQMRQTPDLEGASFGGGLQIDSQDEPSFRKEVKLAFPLPQGLDAGETCVAGAATPCARDAFYYVVRRLEGPPGADGKPTVVFETIDQADVVCPKEKPTCAPEEKKVVTASWPFSGYVDSVGAFDVSGGVHSVTAAYNFLMWTYDQLMPSRSPYGVITGKVQRRQSAPQTGFEPVANAIVTLGEGPITAQTAVAKTQANGDGTFTLTDPRYTGNPLTVAARSEGAEQSATVYALDPADPAFLMLNRFKYVGTVYLTFPPLEAPPPPPAIAIQIVRESDNKDPKGLVVSGTPLLVNLKSGARIMGLTIQGQSVAFTPKDERSLEATASYTPIQTGSYTVSASALNWDMNTFTASVSFLVINPGGGNNEILQDSPPTVINAMPKNDAAGVPVTVFAQIDFSEPVTNVVVPNPAGGVEGTIHLTEMSSDGTVAGEVPFTLLGIDPSGVPVAAVSPVSQVTTLTIQPLVGLKYKANYRISLTSGIHDLDTNGGAPAPKALADYETSFTTFDPESLIPAGQGALFGSAGILVFGDRAYLADIAASTLRAFDVSDPVSPTEIESASRFVHPTIKGLMGESPSPLGERIVGIPSQVGISGPTNLWLYDVSDDNQTREVGAVTLATSVLDGFILSGTMHNGFAYAATFKKGIQVIDLTKVVDSYKPEGSPEYPAMIRALVQGGYGMQNVLSIPVASVLYTGPARLYDIKAAGLKTAGSSDSQEIMVATGDTGFTVVNPTSQQVLFNGAVPVLVDDGQGGQKEAARLTFGYAVGLGQVAQKDVAVVAGTGTVLGQSQYLAVVVDLQNAASPVGIGYVPLDGWKYDVVIRGDTAYIAGGSDTTVVSLAKLTDPRVVGTIVGTGGRIAFGENGQILFGTARSVWGGDSPLGGVRMSALEKMALVTGTSPMRVVVGEGPRSAEAFKILYRVIPHDLEIADAKLEYRIDEATHSTVPVILTEGQGELTLPFGFTLPRVANVLSRVRLVAKAVDGQELVSEPHPWNTSAFQVSLAGEDRNDLEGDYEGDAGENGEPAPLVAGGEADHIGDAVASNAELSRRRLAGEPGSTLGLTWQQQGGVGIYPNQQQRDDGYFSAFLEGRKVSGTLHQATARAADVVLGTSEIVPMYPGAADKVALSLPRDGLLPADGKTEIAFTALATDADGNPVADNTPARCFVDAEDESEGAIVGADDPMTVNGVVECRYRTGVQQLNVDRLTVEVDGVQAQRDVTLLPLKPTVSLNGTLFSLGDEVIATARTGDSDGQPAADGAEVSWLLPFGATLLQRDAQILNGEARARFLVTRAMQPLADATTFEVLVMIGSETATATGLIASPSERLRIEQTRRILAGGLESDGVGFLPAADGGTIEVPVSVRSDFKISGGQPGEAVTFEVGTLEAPNREPEALYLMEDIAGGIVADVLGRHPASVSAEVTLASDSTGEGSSSLKFAGEGRMTIPADGVLAQTLGLQLSVSVNPQLGLGAGSVIRREGAFNLSLLPEPGGHRVHLSVSAGGIAQTLDGAVIPDAAWTQINARLYSGQVVLAIGEAEVGTSVTVVDAGTGDLLVGEGFVGLLDDLKLYHVSGSSPPLLMVETPEGLSERAEGVFDGSGTALFSVRAMPALPGLTEPLDKDVDQLEDMIKRGYYVEFRANSDRAYAEGRIGTIHHDLNALMSYLREALLLGGSEYSDLETTLADSAIGFTPLGVPTAGRDALNLAHRAYLGRQRGQDKFQAALMVSALAVMVVARRAKKVEEAASAFRVYRSLNRMRKAGHALPKAAEWLTRAARDERYAPEVEHVLRALLDQGDEVSEATMRVLAATDRYLVNLQRLNRTLGAASSRMPEVVRALEAIATSGPKGATLLQETLAIAQHSTAGTPKVVEGARRLAMGVEEARAVREQGVKIVVPGPARLANMARNFSPTQVRKVQNVLEDVADIADDTTENVQRLVGQLGSLRGPHNYIARAADGVVRYAKNVGKRVSAFERRLTIPGVVARRDYDASYKLASGGYLDVDVKAWESFSKTARWMRRGGEIVDGKVARPGKEAWKFQKDIVLKFLDPNGSRDYSDLRWAIPKGLEGKKAQIGEWMLDQFDSDFVMAHIPDPKAWKAAKDAFTNALLHSFLDFY